MHSAKFGMTDDPVGWSILGLLPSVIHRISQTLVITTSILKIHVAQNSSCNLTLNTSNYGPLIQYNCSFGSWGGEKPLFLPSNKICCALN